MVSWLSDRVLSVRETLGITPTMFIEIIIFFSLRRSLSQWLDVFQRLRLLGEQLHQDLVPGPSLLQRTGRRSGEDQQWRRKRVCTKAGWQARSVIASGLAGTGVKPAKKSVYLGWQLNSDIQEMVCRWTEWKCSWTVQQFLDQGKSPRNKWTLEWPILLESKCPLWYCLQEAALGLTGIKAESIVIQPWM